MTRQKIENQLLTLSLSDKAEMVQSLTKTLNMSGKGITGKRAKAPPFKAGDVGCCGFSRLGTSSGATF